MGEDRCIYLSVPPTPSHHDLRLSPLPVRSRPPRAVRHRHAPLARRLLCWCNVSHPIAPAGVLSAPCTRVQPPAPAVSSLQTTARRRRLAERSVTSRRDGVLALSHLHHRVARDVLGRGRSRTGVAEASVVEQLVARALPHAPADLHAAWHSCTFFACPPSRPTLSRTCTRSGAPLVMAAAHCFGRPSSSPRAATPPCGT